MSEVELNGIVQEYKKIKEDIVAGLIFKVTPQKIQEEEAKCSSLLDSMSSSNNYDHFEQVVNIQEQYKAIRQTLIHSKKNKYSDKQLETSLKNIVRPNNDENRMGEISSITQIKTEDVIIPEKSKTIQDFFKKREEAISKKQSTFKKILQSKEFQSNINDSSSNKDASKVSKFSKSRSNFRKAPDEEKQAKLKTIIDQHKKSLAKLQLKMKQEEELNDFQKNLLRQEKNRYLGKIQELEDEIQQLYRDNYRLRQLQKTAKEPDSFNMSQLKEKSSLANAYEPYVIKTRSNDLNKINEKNYKKQEGKTKERSVYVPMMDQYDILGEKLEKQKPITAQDFFKKKDQNKKPIREKTSERKEEELVLKALLGESFEHHQPQNISRGNISMGSINNGTHFDTFHMAHTLSYINEQVLGQSRNIMRMTGQISTRNKVSFFKNSLVLVRNTELDIAFKRSDMNERMDKIRIILYINNKTNKEKTVNINYEYQREYFDIKVQEKLTKISSKGQGREVLQVSLISKNDLNGVTDMHVQIGEQIYDLWLPINFIKFKQVQNYHMPNDTMEMTVLPDRQFASFNSLQEILPAMFGGTDSTETWAYLFGESKFGNYPVKLTWKMRDLTIQTTDKWLDFLGFVFHFFK